MSGTSYPSPVSTPRLPILEDSTQRALGGVIPEPVNQEQVDTQRNLHQASTALEAAYRRIRQARRNLLELTETSPPQDPQSRTAERNDFNPGYEAITLTGEQDYDAYNIEDDEFELRRENAPPHAEAPLRQYGTIPALDFQDTDRYDTMLSNSIGSLPFTPPSPHPPTVHLPPLSPYLPPGFHPRRSQLDSQLARRPEILLNDPTTTIGRRVAAREAGGATPVRSLSPWDGASTRFIATIERDIEHVRAAARQRRTDPVRSEIQPADIASRPSRSLDVDITRRSTRNQTLQARATINSTSPLGPPVESRRQRLGRGSALPSPQSPMSNQSGRLSILSNLPVQNLTTPVSAVSRPLLFEEPSSYIPAADFTRQYPNEQNGQVGERSYVIRRTINADGEEHVHPISLEWSDEEASPWALPGGQRDELYVDYMTPPRPHRAPPVRYVQRSDTFQNPQTVNAIPSGAQRRRGWARLDPDGNEIPPDEEEELERVRAELRVNAVRSSLAPPDEADIRPRLHPFHFNTNISQEYELSHNPLRSEPELRDGDTNWYYGSIRDLVPAVTRPSLPPLHQALSQPFVPNPLPMPLEDMVMSFKRVKRDERRRIIRVARHASLAGR